MKPGNKKLIFLILLIFSFSFSSFAEDKILSAPLINLNELKPSFEDVIDDSTTDLSKNEKIKIENQFDVIINSLHTISK